jgi:hypothetical protein
MSSFTNTKFQETFDSMVKSKSFYIPLMPKDIILPNGEPLYKEESLRKLFQNLLGVGEVTHIDYITKPTKVDKEAIAVFVHFAEWNHNGATEYIMRQFNDDGECSVRGYYDVNSRREERFISSFNNRPRFFKMKVNRSPIPAVVEIPTNIHQIVHDNGVMREVLAKQTVRITELEEEIRRLTAMIQPSANFEPNTTVMTVAELE